MKQPATLTIAALFVIVLTTLHLTHDALHNPDEMTPKAVTILLLIALVMLYGTVVLAGRRLGYLVMLLGGLAAASMPYLHTMGPRATRWGFLFVWTLFALGVGGSFTAVLAARALWRSLRAPSSVDGAQS